MRKVFFIMSIIQFYSSFKGYADSFTVTVNQPLIFNYTHIDELLSPKVIDNAFELKIAGKPTATTVTAQLSFADGSVNNSYNGKISLKPAVLNPCNLTLSKEEKVLGITPIILFQQPGSSGGGSCSFNYNVSVGPFTNFVNSGQIGFSILFTMTQP